MMHKVVILLRSLYGYWLKWLYDLHCLCVPTLGEREQADVVVSLTSYGRRVEKGVVCYSVYSILRQTVQPKRIILWLSETEWNDTNLPDKVAALRKKGIEIRYCEDMRSYKKLLPTLALCPDDTIITIDDDGIYSKHLIATLWEEHLKHPKDIVGTLVFKADEKITYPLWKRAPQGVADIRFFTVGVGGVLYPKGSLMAEMIDYKQAKRYAPMADDVWFWAASVAAGTAKRSTDRQFQNISFDAIYQYLHKGSALQHSNVKGHVLTNDMQIVATTDYIKQHYGMG